LQTDLQTNHAAEDHTANYKAESSHENAKLEHTVSYWAAQASMA
jgi:hypothetical protein